MEVVSKVVLITGAFRRAGRSLALHYHNEGLRVFLHTRKEEEGQELTRELNERREDSAGYFACDLREFEQIARMVQRCNDRFGRLDVVVNSAAVFRGQAIGSVTAQDSIDQLSTNLLAPLMLIQAAAPYLRTTKGCVLNITDAHHSLRPLKGYSLYCASKAALDALTKSLALELAPEIRVNAIAPGVLEWPEDWANDSRKQEIEARIPMGRPADYEDLWTAARLLTLENRYMTGVIMPLDGGSGVS